MNQIERAADQLRESAARLEREADLLDSLGETRAGAPHNNAIRGLLAQAGQIDAITYLVEGGEPLKAAVSEVMGVA